MGFVIIGVLLLAAKLAEFGPFATWSWWIVLAPFLAAALWWEFADSTGWTQRRAIDRMEQRKQDRRGKALDALGLGSKRDRQVKRQREAARQRSENMDASGARDLERRDPRL
jgi:small Trp-rich protein